MLDAVGVIRGPGDPWVPGQGWAPRWQGATSQISWPWSLGSSTIWMVFLRVLERPGGEQKSQSGTECLCSLYEFLCWSPNPNVMVLGGGAFGK